MSVLRPSVDAYVLQASPAANRPDTPKLHLSGTASAIKRSYLFFGRPFPYGASILTATLRLTLASAWTGQTLTIRRVTGEWRERTISYNAEPTNTTTNEISQAITGAAGDTVEIDISPLLDDVSAGGAWHGLRLAISSSVDRSFYSSDSATASERPEVDIEWADLPDAPSEMTPSGGMAVSDSKPVLSWRFATQGYEADQEQALSQVQISTSTSFASPEYDSTMTANTQTSWDLAATAYGGLADGATRYWRVRVQDQAGLTSEWSETQQFVRDAKPTLTITSPTTTTEDTTPPIAWDFTGQESWALWLHELTDDGPKELLHVPRNVSTIEEYTIPPGSGYGSTQRSYVKTGRTYRVTVRAWDGADRAATPGDPPYVEATQEFTYVRSGAPDPVTALTATADGPKVALVWSRANRPDFFSLRVDGEEVLTRIDPEEVSTGGTGYAMDWWGATGGVAHTYEIEAVVLTAGKYLHSDGNATASATTRVIGFWLVDPDDSTAVQITGPDDDVDLQIREVGTTFDIIGSRTPVRIVDAVMGYSGSIQGHVESASERDDFLDLKGRLKPLRFMVADLNLEVLLEEVSCAPHRSPAGLYRASAQFFQTDDFTFELAGEATAVASGSEVIDTEGALL